MYNSKEIIEFYYNRKYDNLSNKAYDILEELIVLFILKPGNIYSEKELSEMINVGRTPVREAIKRLEYTRLVEIIPRRGIKISEINIEDFFLQMEVRRLIENLIAVRASKFATPSEREKMLETANRLDKFIEEENEKEILRLDNFLHQYIASCARNPYAKSALIPFHSVARRLYYMEYQVKSDLIKEINMMHSKLLKDIASGDSKAASKTTNELLHLTEKLNKLNINYISGIDIEGSLF